jgi:undecaprenyl-diphosphatase
LGAILSVVVLYWKRFFKSIDFYFKLVVAFIPAAVFGVLLADKLDALLENPISVAISLVMGGVILLFVNDWFKKPTIDDESKISYINAFKIGLFQCIAMIPGVSRSGATIVGGLSEKLTMKSAAEFSFFLAVPTMFAATAKKLYDYYKMNLTLTTEDYTMLGVGNLVAFLVAMLAIKYFITFVTKNGFKVFGVYRIIIGGIILILHFMGVSLQMI